MEATVLKVRKDTDPCKLAKSIEMTAREQNGRVYIRAMGPFSVNQCVKGLIIARENLIAAGGGLAWNAQFDTKIENGEGINVIVFNVALIDA